ncbi:hypothetical protein Sm713_30780 [Streptomyces sp. TS71-3]|nr:hypothetical protein Sm713_30780 [Streptomyces sp. TS71-3]
MEHAGGVVGWATDVMGTLGAPGAGVANAVDTVIPFVPSEVILPIAGFAASEGQMSLTGAIFWATAGSVLGSLVVYYVGALLGRDRTRAVAARIPLIRVHDVDRAEAWFGRHGAKAVFIARMVPVIRSMISIPAGIERMPILTFTALTAMGSLIWNAAFILAGYWLGSNWRVVEKYGGYATTAVVILVVLAVGHFVVSRLRSSKEQNRSE